MPLQQRAPKQTGALRTGPINQNSFGPYTVQIPPPVPVPNTIPAWTGTLPAQPHPSTLGPVRLSRHLLRLNTLAGRFNGLALVGIGLALASMITALSLLSATTQNFRRVINETAPGIIAANKLGQSLQTMDTAAADFQVSFGVRATVSADTVFKAYDNALRAYLTNREEFNNTLFRAYGNVTLPGEKEAVQAITACFNDYSARIETMRFELGKPNSDQGAALALFSDAHNLLLSNLDQVKLRDGLAEETTLRVRTCKDPVLNPKQLGLADNIARLVNINQVELDKTSQSATDSFRITAAFTALVCAILAGTLLLTALYYALATHRVINPGYVLGLALSLIMLAGLIRTINQTETDFKTVSRDSFSSINAVSKAEQIFLDFNGDESRLLLNDNLAGFDPAKTNLGTAPKSFNPETLKKGFEAKEQSLRNELQIAWMDFATPEERVALCTIQDSPSSGRKCRDQERPRGADGKLLPYALDEFITQHDVLIAKFNGGDRPGAIELSFGPSNAAATRVAQSLESLSKIKEREFDKAACASIGVSQFGNPCAAGEVGYLNFWQGLAVVSFSLIVVVILAGAWLSRRLF